VPLRIRKVGMLGGWVGRVSLLLLCDALWEDLFLRRGDTYADTP
jgi:hypothetical protein